MEPLSHAAQERIKTATRAWMKANRASIHPARTNVNDFVNGKPCDFIPWIALYVTIVLSFKTNPERHAAAQAIYAALTEANLN